MTRFLRLLPVLLVAASSATAQVVERAALAEAPVAAAVLPQVQSASLPPSAILAPAALPHAPAPAAVAPRPMRLVVTGPPGAGKGEASTRLTRDYGLVHISAGDLLRAYAATDPAVAAVMARGELVDAELVLRLVRERLSRPDVAMRGFILDGFPRRIVESEAFARELQAGSIGLDAVVVLDVPEEELLRRILARGRPDDTPEVFPRRIRIYRAETQPAIERLRGLVPFLTPDIAHTTDADESYVRVRAALEDFFSGRTPAS